MSEEGEQRRQSGGAGVGAEANTKMAAMFWWSVDPNIRRTERMSSARPFPHNTAFVTSVREVFLIIGNYQSFFIWTIGRSIRQGWRIIFG